VTAVPSCRSVARPQTVPPERPAVNTGTAG
jgi:hypothetical protein